MSIDADLYGARLIPLKSAQEFIDKILPQLGWSNSGGNEVVLDVGCGPGGTTKNVILPLFSSSARIFAMDINPHMIALAKEENSSSQIEYSVADMEDWSSLQCWKNQITKVISISVFQWLKDQRRAFRYVYQLLKKGGEAAIYFPSQSPYFPAMTEIQNSQKWSQYLNKVDYYVREVHTEGYDAAYYKKMLEDIGFEVLYCKNDEKIDVFPSDKAFHEFFTSICVLRNYVPADKLEEFDQDFIDRMQEKNGRTIDGLPLHRGNFMELVVRKT